MSQHTIYYEKLAAAFVRGKLHNHPVREAHPSLFATALEELSEDEQRELIELGLQQGLRLHRFKRTMDLPRVRKVLGILRGVQPATLLDIGSGRGAFLWPLLDAFPYLPVTCVDILAYRAADIQTMHEGGLEQLNALHEDGIVKERYKYVRSGFLQAVFDSESHWQDRPILANQLKEDVSLF